MNKKATTVIAFIAGVIFAAGGLYWWNIEKTHSMAAKIAELQAEVVTKENELLGYTKYTDYLYAGKKTLHEQMKFLAASVVRQEGFTRAIDRNILGLHSDSIVAVWYTAEYSFGYDLKPENYEITETATGINIQLQKPILVAPPSTRDLRHRILSGGAFVDSKAGIIKLYEGIDKRTMGTGHALASDEAIIALCEKKLIAFLQGFFAKQPGVKKIPSITISYKDKAD